MDLIQPSEYIKEQGLSPNFDKFFSWLVQKKNPVQEPLHGYRGVPKGVPPVNPSGDFTHATPFYEVAENGGKGSFGQTGDIYRVPIEQGQRYYRGGALGATPLERTFMGNIRGVSWDNGLDRINEEYKKQRLDNKIVRAQNEVRKFGYPEQEMQNVARNKFMDFYNQIRNGLYEYDANQKPGLWANENQKIPYGSNWQLPRLISGKEIAKTLGTAFRGITPALQGVQVFDTANKLQEIKNKGGGWFSSAKPEIPKGYE